jgi:hypothetical protein
MLAGVETASGEAQTLTLSLIARTLPFPAPAPGHRHATPQAGRTTAVPLFLSHRALLI